ncbi:MAG TPA: tetratricopeptide repeat protein, partial [Thermodesulfobacteriota bacterium]|nr:tetratricopeptide repeat protein [Thermodesulfobacteriota bacterium]
KYGSRLALPVDPVEEIFFQALRHEDEEDWDRARTRYESALRIDPGHLHSLVNLGNMLYRLGRRREAEAQYRKALRIDPDHVEANYNLANLFEERGDLENAILFHEKAIHENPDFADAHFNLARLLERTGDLAGARRHWRKYLDLDPASEWAPRVRARLREGI